MQDLWTLFWAFVRIGAFTFGGGYAMLPMLQKEIVEKYHWTTEAELMDYFAVGQCTPGVIAVNTATFVGYRKKKTAGAITATLGVIAPSIIIIMVIAAVLQNFSELAITQHAFTGIRIVVAVLIVNVVVQMFKASVKDGFCIFIFCLSLVIGLFLNLSPVYAVVISGILGVIVQRMKGFKNL